MFRLLTRGCAYWLVCLVVLPCTAPLSTCTLPDLFADHRADSAPWPGREPSSILTERALSHALPSPVRLTRLRQDAVALTHTAELFADLRRTAAVGSTTARATHLIRLPDLMLRI
jgi:hypothetical protein